MTPPTADSQSTTDSQSPADPQSPEDGYKQRLMAKLMAGTASDTELRMLKALCMNDGDRPCRNAAVTALKAKKTE